MTQQVLVPDDIMEATRLSSIAADFATLGVYASKSDEVFVEAKQEINWLIRKFIAMQDTQELNYTPTNTGFDEAHAVTRNIIRNPIVVKTKGMERENARARSQPRQGPERGSGAKQRRCRVCNEVGHNRANCCQPTAKNHFDSLHPPSYTNKDDPDAGTSSQHYDTSQGNYTNTGLSQHQHPAIH